MELILEARFEGEGGIGTGPTGVYLPCGTSWSATERSARIVLPVQPDQAARLLKRSGVQPHPEKQYHWILADNGTQENLRITLVAEPAEWQALEQSLLKTPRSKPIRPLSSMHLEWPFFHPSFCDLRAGDFLLGNNILRLIPEDGLILLSAPADYDSVSTLVESGYSLHPIDDWQEEVWWEETEVARLLKPEMLTADAGSDSPFLLLHGMQHSLAHPVFMHPFLPALPQVNIREMERIISETMINNDELELSIDEPEEPLEDFDSAFQQEYSGFDADDLDLLLRVPAAMTENLANEALGDVDLADEEWLTQVFSLLVISSICGSRLARAELARMGYDVSLDKRLGDKDCMDLAAGILHFTDALFDAVGDSRSAHIWSLPRLGARDAEILLDGGLVKAMPDGLDIEMATMDIYLAFDLGVRYQMARSAPILLIPNLEVEYTQQEEDEDTETPDSQDPDQLTDEG